MDTQKTESIVTLSRHPNGTGSQVNTSSGEVFKEFTDSNDYQVNFKAAGAWLAEHGFVHAGGSDYAKYDLLMIGDTSGSNYE